MYCGGFSPLANVHHRPLSVRIARCEFEAVAHLCPHQPLAHRRLRCDDRNKAVATRPREFGPGPDRKNEERTLFLACFIFDLDIDECAELNRCVSGKILQTLLCKSQQSVDIALRPFASSRVGDRGSAEFCGLLGVFAAAGFFLERISGFGGAEFRFPSARDDFRVIRLEFLDEVLFARARHGASLARLQAPMRFGRSARGHSTLWSRSQDFPSSVFECEMPMGRGMAEEIEKTHRFGWLAAIWLAVVYLPLVPLNYFLGFCLRDRRRFLPLEEYPELNQLTHGFSKIRGELLALEEAGRRIPSFAEIDPGQVRLAGDGQWKTFLFKIFGVEVPRNLELCPETAELLNQVPRITMAMFSILEPGKRLPLHTGAYRGVLRYLLPLVSTEPDKCAITVGGETHAFEEGVPLLFDDVFPHTAWNLGEDPRVVLFIDVERRMPWPWLTRLNRFCLGVLARAKRMKRAAGRAVVD